MKKLTFFLLGLLCSHLLFIPYLHASTTTVSVDTNMSPTSYNNCQGTSTSQETSLLLETSCYNWKTGVRVDGPTKTVGSQWSMDSYTSTYNGSTYVITFTLSDEPAEPETCFNSVQDGDEEGINCGGSCSAACESICPPNTENLTGFDGEPGCFWYGVTDNLGNCPSGTLQSAPYGVDGCYKSYDYIMAAAGTSVDPVEDPGFTSGTLSVVKQVYPTTTEDNGDGTSTKTTITDATDPDGTKTTTTQSDIVDNTTGETLSSTTTTDVEKPAEENPDNYDFDIGPIDLPDTDFTEMPEEKNFDNLFDQIDSWNPFSNFDEEMKVTVSNPTCSFDCSMDLTGMHLGSYTLAFGLCEYEWAFNGLGVVLNFLAALGAFYIVVRGR